VNKQTRYKRLLVGALALGVVATAVYAITHRVGTARAASAHSLVGASVPSQCYKWPILAYGSTGSYVSFAQLDLNNDYQAHWFPNSPYNFHPPLAVDGIFGDKTLAAVKDIQTHNHVKVDGIIGPVTWNLINPGCGLG
jgi:peptidoglycan hydrolase-like protein with peptidoglycan-binding domain